MHKLNEHVEVKDVELLTDIYTELLDRFLSALTRDKMSALVSDVTKAIFGIWLIVKNQQGLINFLIYRLRVLAFFCRRYLSFTSEYNYHGAWHISCW